MAAIQRILFPVDFSKSCVGAAHYVEAIAGRFEAEVRLLHVVNTGTYYYAQDAHPHLCDKLQRFLYEDFQFLKTSRICELGDPATKIVEMVRDWRPDLVMLPTHGFGMYRRLLIGSVTTKILHDVDCPVWTDVHCKDAPPLEKIQFRKMLCAVDLCGRSKKVLDWAADLAGEYGAELGIVHALPRAEAGAMARSLDQEFLGTMESEARGKLAKIQPSGVSDDAIFFDSGEPARVISCAAKRFGADMLMIGRHDGSGFMGRLRHTAYNIVRDAPCPVISV
jgi:nucleotide-binding universal stress UspA family protein